MKKIKSIVTTAIILSSLLTAEPLLAAEHAENAAGPKYAKLEPITVNLQGLIQYLQAGITLKVASTEAEEAVKLYMPMVRHELILLLSSKEVGQITSLEGKQKLTEESRRAANKAISMSEKQGVTEVLFESFVIQ